MLWLAKWGESSSRICDKLTITILADYTGSLVDLQFQLQTALMVRPDDSQHSLLVILMASPPRVWIRFNTPLTEQERQIQRQRQIDCKYKLRVR